MPQFGFTSPTPLASALSALATLLIFAAGVLLISFLHSRFANKADESDSTLYKITERIGAIDRFIVRWTSWVTGTRYENRFVRIPVMVLFFLALVGTAVFAPWPWGLFPILIGVLGIFCVFRHYSRHEDEILDEVPEDNRMITIGGHLQWEVLLAVGFLFVFAPIAFSQLQEHGYGFQIEPKAGPLTFVVYTMIETLKAGSLVDYYDLFADRTGFDKITNAKNPTEWAKWVILAYRLSMNLLLLAAIKRLFDIAQRRSKGLDMRHLEEKLRDNDAEQHNAVVEELRHFAFEGSRIARLNAEDLLERILKPADSDGWKIGVQPRYRASRSLAAYGEHRRKMVALYAAIKGYRDIAKNDWTQDEDPEHWSIVQNDLGNALFDLGEMEGGTDRYDEALAVLKGGFKACHLKMGQHSDWDWAHDLYPMIVNGIANAHARIGELKGRASDFEDAIYFYRDVLLFVYDREDEPNDWADAQTNLGTRTCKPRRSTKR